MNPHKKPPRGVTPRHEWQKTVPDPTVWDLYHRYRAVSAAVGRYRAAGREVPKLWLRELGVLGR